MPDKKTTVTLYANVEPSLRVKLDEIALKRRRANDGRRVTVTDLVVEALEQFVEREDQQSATTSDQ